MMDEESFAGPVTIAPPAAGAGGRKADSQTDSKRTTVGRASRMDMKRSTSSIPGIAPPPSQHKRNWSVDVNESANTPGSPTTIVVGSPAPAPVPTPAPAPAPIPSPSVGTSSGNLMVSSPSLSGTPSGSPKTPKNDKKGLFFFVLSLFFEKED